MKLACDHGNVRQSQSPSDGSRSLVLACLGFLVVACSTNITGSMSDSGESGLGTDASTIDDTDAAPVEPLLIHMASNGDDANDGSTVEKPVKTLERVHEILVATKPQSDVHVMVAAGTYRGQVIRWTYTNPDYEIVIRRTESGGASAGPRPRFDGCLSEVDCPGGTWFRLGHSDGERTNIRFQYLEITNYATAISFDGNRDSTTTFNSHNSIYGCMFIRIGNISDPSRIAASTAAVRLVNSDYNVIENNHFIDSRNTPADARFHAIYVAHLSSNNTIERNRFAQTSGDPVRFRDFSNDNIVRENRFEKAGVAAGYTDWYCDHDVRDDCTKATQECPSWNNQFRDNELHGNWSCENLSNFELFQGSSPSGCIKPSGASRVSTSGNLSGPCP